MALGSRLRMMKVKIRKSLWDNENPAFIMFILVNWEYNDSKPIEMIFNIVLNPCISAALKSPGFH